MNCFKSKFRTSVTNFIIDKNEILQQLQFEKIIKDFLSKKCTKSTSNIQTEKKKGKILKNSIFSIFKALNTVTNR